MQYAHTVILRDKAQASVRAAELRKQGLSLRQIGAKLCSENYLPARSEVWHAASILDLLRLAESQAATRANER
jgi:hypothetical protein